MSYLNEVSEDSNVICNQFKTFFQSAYSDNTLNICNNADVTPVIEISNINITEMDVEQALSSLKNIIQPGSDGKKLSLSYPLCYLFFLVALPS